MPSLMDLPAELHIQIVRYIVFDGLLNGQPYISAYYNPSIRALRTQSAYWTVIIDHLLDEELARRNRSNPWYNQGMFSEFMFAHRVNQIKAKPERV